MISADYYYTIYLIIITVLTFVTCRKPANKNGDALQAMLLCVFMIIFIGFRPLSGKIFIDMGNYAVLYKMADWKGFDWNTDNLLFDNLFIYLGGNGFGIYVFFVIIAAIYFGGIFVACRKFFPNNTLLAFLVCLAAFSTFSFATNGIKAGAAASIFLVALAYRDKLFMAIPLALVSWGFHHSMQLPVAAYVLALLFRKTPWYFAFWMVCLVLSLLHVTYFQTIFAGWTDEQGAGYLNSIDAAFVKHKGFRYDFVFYSIFPMLMGYYAVFKYKFKDKLYDVLLRTYIMTNAIWLLCMYAPFTNRIAYLSWFMYPILLIYPCMKDEGGNWPLVVKRNMVVGLHLSFTIFMTFIYY